MKAVLALTAATAVSASALLPRQLDSIPSCALQCAIGSLGSTGCDTTDFACICQAQAFISSLIPCVQGACNAQQLQDTIQGASGLCAAAGVTLSIPSDIGGSTSAPAGTETSSAPAETTATETTTEAMTETSSAATVTETAATETTMTETMATTTEAPSETAGANGTVTTPPTPTGTEPGAASRNTVALGSLGAIVALFAAFL